MKDARIASDGAWIRPNNASREVEKFQTGRVEMSRVWFEAAPGNKSHHPNRFFKHFCTIQHEQSPIKMLDFEEGNLSKISFLKKINRGRKKCFLAA